MRTNWTYSSISTYRKCPRRYDLRYNQKVPDPQGPAAARGEAIHGAMENYINTGDASAAHIEDPQLRAEALAIVRDWQKMLDQLRAGHAVAEELWRFDVDWYVPTGLDDTWAVMKLDAFVNKAPVARVVDFKTGREYPRDHAEQMEIYALGAWARRVSDTQTVVAELWYLDQGPAHGIRERSFTPQALRRLEKKWRAAAGEVLHAALFPARPSPDNCKWCPYSKMKGGQCGQDA